MILVVDASESTADNLKELIEFMDSPRVCVAAPDQWREAVGENRLEALFVGSALTSREIEDLLDGIGELDPNIPIVMMKDIEPQ